MIRRQRTPKIIDDGHGWRSDAVAHEKAGNIANAIRFPKGWADEFDGGTIALSPTDVMMAMSPTNADLLLEYEESDGQFLYNHILKDADCEEMGEFMRADMTPAQKRRLGSPWLHKTNATRTALTCRMKGSNAPEGMVVYEKTLNLHMDEKSFWLEYQMELVQVYVLSGSRGKSLGHALVAPLALDFQEDVWQLRKSLVKIKERRLGHLDLSFTLGGDIASDGGRALYNGLRNSMCGYVDNCFTVEQQERHLMTDLVEEETEDMYVGAEDEPDDIVRSLPEGFRFRP